MYQGPPIITDGPMRAGHVAAATPALGVAAATSHWLVVLGVFIAMIGMLALSFGAWARRRNPNQPWRR